LITNVIIFKTAYPQHAIDIDMNNMIFIGTIFLSLQPNRWARSRLWCSVPRQVARLKNHFYDFTFKSENAYPPIIPFTESMIICNTWPATRLFVIIKTPPKSNP
jgi:hypothetical protein